MLLVFKGVEQELILNFQSVVIPRDVTSDRVTYTNLLLFWGKARIHILLHHYIWVIHACSAVLQAAILGRGVWKIALGGGPALKGEINDWDQMSLTRPTSNNNFFELAIQSYSSLA